MKTRSVIIFIHVHWWFVGSHESGRFKEMLIKGVLASACWRLSEKTNFQLNSGKTLKDQEDKNIMLLPASLSIRRISPLSVSILLWGCSFYVIWIFKVQLALKEKKCTGNTPKTIQWTICSLACICYEQHLSYSWHSNTALLDSHLIEGLGKMK